MPASVDQLRREREYTPDGALHYHVSVGPSGSVTIGPSQASFVPVRGKYRDEILDGGWPSVWSTSSASSGRRPPMAGTRPTCPRSSGASPPGAASTWTSSCR